MKAKINSGHQRHARTKTPAPTRPGKVQLRSGFQPVTSGLNTSGSPGAIPHNSGPRSTPAVYGRVGKKRMY